VFCDLDHQRQRRHAGRRRSTTRSLPSPALLRDGPGPGVLRGPAAAADPATAFRQPDTGESPSRIDASGVLFPVPARRGIATSTALDDQLDVSAASSLRHSMASPPAHEELVQTTLQRSDRDDGFGFSLSNGVYDSGVYVGAVKEQGPAADKLHPYDRILKVACRHWRIQDFIFWGPPSLK